MDFSTFNNKNIIIVILNLVFILGLSFLVYLVVLKEPKNQVCHESVCFKVETATTDEEHVRGLSGRQDLDQNKGMFFVFENSDKYTFWMKDTLISLDIIWINKNGEVVYIKKNAEPCKSDVCEPLVPDGEAKYVLEINGGKAEEIGLNVGNALEISGDIK